MPITPKQQRFAEEYLVDLNATQAAIRAGYSVRTASSQGERLLRNVEVQAAVSAGQQRRSERTEITADRVLRELAKIGFSDIRKAVLWRSKIEVKAEDADGAPVALAVNDVQLVDSAELDDATAAAIAEISQTKEGALKLKLHDKRAALVDIGKHLGMFVERTENTNINYDVSDTPLSEEEWAEQHVVQ